MCVVCVVSQGPGCFGLCHSLCHSHLHINTLTIGRMSMLMDEDILDIIAAQSEPLQDSTHDSHTSNTDSSADIEQQQGAPSAVPVGQDSGLSDGANAEGDGVMASEAAEILRRIRVVQCRQVDGAGLDERLRGADVEVQCVDCAMMSMPVL